jgi:hypothetical protein
MPTLTLAHLVEAASALHSAGRHASALDCWNVALEVAPDDPAILTGAAVTLRALQQPERAEAAIRRAVELEPTPRRQVILACTIHDQLRFDEAEEAIRKARRVDPNSADAAGLLGIWLLERWHWRDTSDDVLAEATEVLDRATELAPGNVEFHTARLASLIAADRLDEVIRDATALCNHWPNRAELHIQRAAARMKLGKLVQGYREFGDWAYRLPRLAGHPFHTYRQWDPALPESEVYIWNVEGAGDYFQFVRYAKRMAEEGWTVRCIANNTMDRLIARVPGVAAVVTEDADIPQAAIMAPLVRLPAEYVGAEPLWRGPYLSADEATIRKWRRRLENISGIKVGIAWRGNPNQANDERRSFEPTRFAPLADIPGISLISLQHRHDDADHSLFAAVHSRIIDLGEDYQNGDWLETAGVIANLDLVIAPCTGIAHLTGAMGKPVWLALSEPGCWRWMDAGVVRDAWCVEREVGSAPSTPHAPRATNHASPAAHSPWYPSMRIFRQSDHGGRGSWAGMFEAMACALAERAREAA